MTAAEIIDELGGPTAVAAALGVKVTRVSNWRSFGKFPDRLSIHRDLAALCAARGIDLDPALFEQRRSGAAA